MTYKHNQIVIPYGTPEGNRFNLSVTYSIELGETGHGNYKDIDILNVDFLGNSITSMLNNTVLNSLKLKVYITELASQPRQSAERNDNG